MPVVDKVTKHAGVAGQFSVTAQVTYEGEPPATIEFVGSVYGGPVIMITPGGAQHFVSDPGRHGEFGTAWVKRFFTDREV